MITVREAATALSAAHPSRTLIMKGHRTCRRAAGSPGQDNPVNATGRRPRGRHRPKTSGEDQFERILRTIRKIASRAASTAASGATRLSTGAPAVSSRSMASISLRIGADALTAASAPPVA